MIQLMPLIPLARVGATSPQHWNRLFAGLQEQLPVHRICAALQVDAYTAYLPRVAQIPELDALLGREGLYADRERSRTFEVIAGGEPWLARPSDWQRYPDLAFYGAAGIRANVKLPVSLSGYPTVWNLWSLNPEAFTEADLAPLADLAAELSRSPFQFDPQPVGLALRQAKLLAEQRAVAMKA